MRKIIFLALIFVFYSSRGSCCVDSPLARTEAARSLYADRDIVNYVCIDEAECKFEAFFSRLTLKDVSLNNSGAQGLQIEPKTKGRQYFSAIFLNDRGKYHLVFAPDTSYSDVSIRKTSLNKFYPVVAIERESTDKWKEYTFNFDAVHMQYMNPQVQCVAKRGNHTIFSKCE